MNVLSFIADHRIEASNVLIELNIIEYLDMVKYVLEKNEYQRRKVIKSNLQETLRMDLLKGCTIPPIVLAVKKDVMDPDFNYAKFGNKKVVEEIIASKEVLILDGLQRTYVMLELLKEIEKKNNQVEGVEKFKSITIRAELYVGLQKLGILYRMLTLNTGQTTMSTRHFNGDTLS